MAHRLHAVPLAVASSLLLAACTADTPPAEEPPAGGPERPRATPPTARMDRVERSVAAKLAGLVAADGLTVQHLDCPPWHGRLPAELTCTGWFDWVAGEVEVRLRAGGDGSVRYDARLAGGVVATVRLVRRLAGMGYVDVDCGPRPAYPAITGDRLVCLVTRDGEHGHVVATMTGPDGRLTLDVP